MRMKVGWFSALLIGTLAMPALGQDSSSLLRSFERFEFDSENARGLWTELAGMYAEDGDINVTTLEARVAYGERYGELGLILPYINVDDDTGSAVPHNPQSVSDLRLYAKGTPLQTALLDIGGGFELTVPTGRESRGLGAGEVGYLPYLNTSLHLNVVDVRAHFGYHWYSGDPTWDEELVYGGGFFIPLGHSAAARLEFVGTTPNERGADSDEVSFEPGLDFRFPLQSDLTFIFRPTGLIGMTSSAPDWGIGTSFVLAWSPD